jgi:hypothetical protein
LFISKIVLSLSGIKNLDKMEKEFIGYTEALSLKELGFDEPCLAMFDEYKIFEYNSILYNANILIDCVSVPLYQQCFRWFREKYGLRGFIGFRPNVKQFDCHIYDMSLSGKEYVKQRTMEEFNKDPKVGTYEEAELECLVKLIDIVKK